MFATIILCPRLVFDMTKKSEPNPLSQTTPSFQNLGAFVGDALMVCVKDKAQRHLYTNASYEAFFRASQGALIGTTIKDSIRDKGQAAEIESRDAQVLKTGSASSFIEQFDFGDKKVNCATIRFPYKDGEGNTIGVAFAAIALNDENQYLSEESHAKLDKAERVISDLQKTVVQLETQATTDHLTGVWNRAYIETSAKRELEMFNRYGHPFSVIFADLDHFKSINDKWGHAVGDNVLKEFCSVLQTSLRATDIFGRWGGEEFVVLLPNTGRASANIIAERFRATISEHKIDDVGHVTSSFGRCVNHR